MAKVLAFVEFDYVLREDREKPRAEQTVFRLRPLTFREQEELSHQRIGANPDQAEREVWIDRDPMRTAREILNRGLMNWGNLQNGAGTVDFEVRERKGKRELTEETLNAILPWWNELANEITQRSVLEEDTAKNSGSP